MNENIKKKLFATLLGVAGILEYESSVATNAMTTYYHELSTRRSENLRLIDFYVIELCGLYNAYNEPNSEKKVQQLKKVMVVQYSFPEQYFSNFLTWYQKGLERIEKETKFIGKWCSQFCISYEAENENTLKTVVQAWIDYISGKRDEYPSVLQKVTAALNSINGNAQLSSKAETPTVTMEGCGKLAELLLTMAKNGDTPPEQSLRELYDQANRADEI